MSSYRHDEMNENTRFTKYEGYKPLRFVAYKPRSAVILNNEDALQKIIDIRRFLRPRKRKAEISPFEHEVNHTSLVIEEIN